MRLINADLLTEQYNLDNATKYGNKDAKQQSFSYDTMMMYEIADMIDDAPTVPAIPIPKNATNGDMLKAVFPEREVVEHDKHIEFAWGDGMDEFDKGWWNAPYKRGDTE